METWLASAFVLGSLVTADIDLPPAKYDHPYRGHVEYVYDYPMAFEGDYLWGYTEAPSHPGGTCVIHLSPPTSRIGDQVMTETAFRRLLRHETGHCNGWRHKG